MKKDYQKVSSEDLEKVAGGTSEYDSSSEGFKKLESGTCPVCDKRIYYVGSGMYTTYRCGSCNNQFKTKNGNWFRC